MNIFIKIIYLKNVKALTSSDKNNGLKHILEEIMTEHFMKKIFHCVYIRITQSHRSCHKTATALTKSDQFLQVFMFYG